MVCSVTLPLLSSFPGVTRKTPSETCRLAECVGETRTLLRKILAESKCPTVNNHRSPGSGAGEKSVFHALMERIMQECHRTFVKSFQAFYPTASLKWTCLCDLLNWIEPVSSYSGLLFVTLNLLSKAHIKL